jgi:mannose-6-phosphate isomerase-like protein (cupin superfamily)
MTTCFQSWTNYSGLLYEDDTFAVFGIETAGSSNPFLEVPARGACFGFIQTGRAMVNDGDHQWQLRAGEWFTLPACCTIYPQAEARVVVTQRIGYQGVAACGGPIELLGRLKYIDGCSDTLLACPPLLGDPCLNHLHFPPGIDQTEHTHPSLRAGIVASGEGVCVTPDGETRLTAGLIFVIPTDGRHKFRTDENSMDVIAYHPDSDWGPTHEEHPMVNRTLVGGEKIDNTQGVHAEAEIVTGELAGFVA